MLTYGAAARARTSVALHANAGAAAVEEWRAGRPRESVQACLGIMQHRSIGAPALEQCVIEEDVLVYYR